MIATTHYSIFIFILTQDVSAAVKCACATLVDVVTITLLINTYCAQRQVSTSGMNVQEVTPRDCESMEAKYVVNLLNLVIGPAKEVNVSRQLCPSSVEFLTE